LKVTALIPLVILHISQPQRKFVGRVVKNFEIKGLAQIYSNNIKKLYVNNNSTEILELTTESTHNI
jgi:hypothetical protein